MKINKEIEFETLHSNKHRIYLLCGIVCVVVLMVTLIITTSKAKYKTTQSLPLINGTINYELSDLNLIGAYIQEGEEYKQVNEIPTSGYEFNSEKSYCTVSGENINATINFDIETQTLSVVPLTKKGTKCYLYFDEKSSGNEYILASPNAPTGTTTDWTGQTTYYYTGNPNNWVQFAGFWWRIIRINGDGSIRMIYQGTSANETGTGTQIQTSAFNSSYNHNRYVGYMYGSSNSDYNSTHTNTNPSTIKGILDTWYSKNLASNSDKIDGNAGFCGDRRISSGTGGGTSETDYQPSTRISNSSPSLSCNKNDIYTIDEFEHGNGALTYPIGLISADEAMFAGIPKWNSSNSNNYLYTGESYWTMSPCWYYDGYAYVFHVYDDGNLDYNIVNWTGPGVRPVINLRSDVPIAGSGTTSDPFKVVGAS